VIAYKLMRRKANGKITSLFINKSREYHFGEWMDAEFIPTKGFAQRQGWHCTFTQYAPHLSTRGRVWVKCEVEDWTTYDRPESQGGAWILANKIKLLEVM
jgi:hypothetical protein